MESLFDSLKKAGILLDFESYGVSDVATYHEINSLIQHSEFVLGQLNVVELRSINSYEDLCTYFLLHKIVKFKEIRGQIKSEYIHSFDEIINIAEEKICCIKPNCLIKYISNDYLTIFEKNNNYDLQHIVLGFIVKYQTGVSDVVFLYLAKEHKSYILNVWDDLKTKHNDVDFILALFPLDFNLKQMKLLGIERVFNVFSKVLNKNKFLIIENINKLIDKMIDEEIVLIKDKSYFFKNIIIEANLFNQMLNSLMRIKYPGALRLQKLKNEIDSNLDSYLKTHGQVFHETFSVEESISSIKNAEHWQNKIALISHFADKSKRYKSLFSCSSKGRRNLIDYISSNIPSDDYYSMSHQTLLNGIFIEGAAVIISMWQDEDLYPACKEWYCTYLNLIDETTEWKNNLVDDIDILFPLLDKVFNSFYKGDSVELGMIYGACMLICAMIEKLLRVIFTNNCYQKEVYVPIKDITLGSLLKSKEIENILGVYHTKNLLFFLSSIGEDKIGRNLRNMLAHLENDITQALSHSLVGGLFFIYTDILNSIVLNLNYPENYKPE